MLELPAAGIDRADVEEWILGHRLDHRGRDVAQDPGAALRAGVDVLVDRLRRPGRDRIVAGGVRGRRPGLGNRRDLGASDIVLDQPDLARTRAAGDRDVHAVVDIVGGARGRLQRDRARRSGLRCATVVVSRRGRQRDVAAHRAWRERRTVVRMEVDVEGVLRDRVERDRRGRPGRVAGALNLHRLQVRVDNDQRVSRLCPTHVVDNAAANAGRQVIVAAAVDVGLHHAVLDDVHAVVREHQHVGVIDRELERHQAHAVAGAARPAVGELEDVLGAWPALQPTLGLDQHIGSLGQRVVVGSCGCISSLELCHRGLAREVSGELLLL